MEAVPRNVTVTKTCFCVASLFLTYKLCVFVGGNGGKRLSVAWRVVSDCLGGTRGRPLEDVAKCMFFSSENLECRKHILAKAPCARRDCSHHKLQQLVHLLRKATTSIHLCMYLITCKQLSDALTDAHNSGIKVKAIIEEEMSTSSESRVQHLIHAGIQVRSKKLPTLMHHKFCLVDAELDDRAKLLTGSLNWTLQGLAGNSENIIIVNDRPVVEIFYQEFNSMWNYFDAKQMKPIPEKKSRNFRSNRWLK